MIASGVYDTISFLHPHDYACAGLRWIRLGKVSRELVCISLIGLRLHPLGFLLFLLFATHCTFCTISSVNRGVGGGIFMAEVLISGEQRQEEKNHKMSCIKHYWLWPSR